MDLGLPLPLCVLWNIIFYLVLNSFEIVTQMAAGIENDFFFLSQLKKKEADPGKVPGGSQVFVSLMFQMLWIFYQCSYHSDHHKGMKCSLEMQSEPCILPQNSKTLATGTLTPLPFREASRSLTKLRLIWVLQATQRTTHPHLNSPKSPSPCSCHRQPDQVTKGAITTQWRTASEAQHLWLHAPPGWLEAIKLWLELAPIPVLWGGSWGFQGILRQHNLRPDLL